MAIAQVIYCGEVLIDLTKDTVTPDTLTKGVTAHAKDGTPITGTNAITEEQLADAVQTYLDTNPIIIDATNDDGGNVVLTASIAEYTVAIRSTDDGEGHVTLING